MKNINNKLKLNILFIFVISIITVSIVPKTFQNDTFFNISIGKYILENGIDMKEHFSWISNLNYTYSHWAFDIIVYLIYSTFGFSGIYIGVIILSIIINLSLYFFLYKLNKNPYISVFITILFSFLNSHYYSARSQIISYLCFIIEIFCIEKIVETNEKKYSFIIFLIGIIVANFHAAAWPLIFILFLPYITAAFFNYMSKKIMSVKDHSPYKIAIRSNYNTKHLIIIMFLTIITGFITPIHNVPFTYLINSMFGHSNFENLKSIDYVSEMKPLIPANNLSFLVFAIILVELLLFIPTKLKLEHGFLVLGLLLMTFISNRYIALLIFMGSFVITDLISQLLNKYDTNAINQLNSLITSNVVVFFILSFCLIYAIYKISINIDIEFISSKKYPVNATEYILNNVDYKNMRIYNDYNVGSYLMLNNIPVFIDSRLDVYCSEFNNTDIFKDYINITYDNQYYDEIFKKYDFTHILLKNDEKVLKYIKKDTNYSIIYEDEYFTLFERN